MGPFIEKIKGMDKAKLPSVGEWAFLQDWESPIVEEKLEVLGDRGKRDAKVS
jgi:acid phosphatase